MKAKLVIGLLSLLMLNGALSGTEKIATFDVSKAKTVALAAIKEKKPDINVADLTFSDASIRISNDETLVISVNFATTTPRSSNSEEDGGMKTVTIRTPTITVEMDANGTVSSVRDGSTVNVMSKQIILPKK